MRRCEAKVGPSLFRARYTRGFSVATRMNQPRKRQSNFSAVADIRAHGLAIAVCLAACAPKGGSTGAAQPRSEGQLDIGMGPSAYNDGEKVLAAWLIYGTAKAKAFEEHPPPAANESADDFETELAARTAQAEFWAEQRKQGAPAHAVLDQQVEVWAAGLLPELVIAVHGRPGWTIPPSALGKLNFDALAQRFAGDYPAGAPVVIRPPSGKPIPDVPGADFPDPARLPMGQASCSTALDERKAAWRRFEALETRLGGVAVSAGAPLVFAHELMAARGETVHKARGVTWVSPRVGHLAALDAFCAVERKDWPDAMRALTRAVSLLPDQPVLRLELALAVTAINRPDEALAQVTRTLQLTRNGCVVGMAFRRRGYILVEKGALEAAQEAYQTSLKYDPQNAIARGELAHIGQLRRERRSRTPEPMVSSVPPFGMTVTECRPETGQ
jgi:tetratricopeptide (TPR) repeat protein